MTQGHLLTAEMQEETRGKIRAQLSPLLPDRWCAFRETHSNVVERCGFGPTKEEAIADLLEKERT